MVDVLSFFPTKLTSYLKMDCSRALEEKRQLLFEDLLQAKYEHEWLVLQKACQLKTQFVDIASSVVSFGKKNELKNQDHLILKECLESRKPWKKGPFRLFGIDIEAEWQSNLKWQRMLPHIGSLKNKVVADIGCHNGYFMFRMAALNPKVVIGFEPYAKHWFTFQWLQSLSMQKKLIFERLGVENIDLLPSVFDSIFCLGILYHQTDPVGVLRKIHKSLAPKGRIFIDCQGIPGDQSVCLVPRGRYAGAKGMWALPTKSCLFSWLQRSQFVDINCFFAEPLSCDEQRQSSWADIKSLKDFLDPNDPTKTIEGYPAPWRFYISARKG